MKLFERVNNKQTYVIAEMSGNHAGSYEHAIEIVHAAALAGADCLKIQTYTPDTLTLDCSKPEFLLQDGLWAGQRLYDLYGQATTPWEWHQGIKDECEKLGMDFLSKATLSGLAEGMRFIINNDGPYLIHCNEGKDRAGFVSALIECPILNCTAFYAISSADSFFRACFTLILLMQTIRSAPPTKPAAAEMAI